MNHFNLRQTLKQYTSPSTRLHETLQSLKCSYSEESWMTELRALLMPLKVWKTETSAEVLVDLLKREGFQVSVGTRTAYEQCLHIVLEESSKWALAEVQVCGGRLTNVFLHNS